ncbi:S8 family serine peptidase [Pseudoduganella sp. FT25W]|uniref:S8 family serine peptidase n=1 Tax=Duganella alba TaxID=2666081 RepID=A0A6L5QMG2_9BURK|nr:S8 family serine peptidase [Duganella alba]MRX10867.1 S8 family serine peptidase [Duganella alba]MRX16559.1 S8 family serine peptidase [Duganella alba]
MPKNPNGGSSTPPDLTTSVTDGDTAGPAETSMAGSGRRSTGSSAGGAEARTTDTLAGGADGEAAPHSNGHAGSAGRNVSARKKQFVIAPRNPPEGLQTLGFQPLAFDALEQALRNSSDIDVVDKVGPRSVLSALANGSGSAQGVLVARMTEQKAAALHQQGQGRLLVERDQHLALMDPSLRLPAMVTGVTPTNGGGPVLNAVISVVGKDGAPQANAEVSLFGSMLPASGVTDANGQVTLSLFGETPDTVRGLYVKPKADHWSFYQSDPDISNDQPNVVALRALSDWPALSGFPRQRCYGWGQKAMRLDQLPGNYRGQGVKIAIIDSGAATSHDNLHGIRAGFDVLNKQTSPDSWDHDTLGHGTHCAGVIAAADIASGIRGFAPDAEVHACKLFPGGQVSQLIDALEYCIDKQIDVVNLSLGGAEVSEALEQQIIRAKRAGVACVVAAGNSGGAVQYPASSPNVLAVAAIGKLDEFPADSYHAQTLDSNVDAYGYFTAKFSCFGPQVAVCAPGVAITSCVPPNNFAAWDGTSMATPHVTGLAALTLAHHPDFQAAQYSTRGPERVERLFQIIRASAHRVSQADQSHIGFGLPDVLVAVGLQTQPGQQPPQPVAPQSAGVMAPMVAGLIVGNPVVYDPLGLDMARAQMLYNPHWQALHVGQFPLPKPYNPIMW